MFRSKPKSESTLGSVWKSVVLDTIDHHLKLEEGLAQAGLNWVDSGLNAANLSSHGRGVERNGKLDFIEFPQDLPTPAIDLALESFGEPGGSAELAAVALWHPELQRERILVFPGASWVDPHGDRYVGVLDGGARSRLAGFLWARPELLWDPHCVWAVRPRK
jgi:hypothetical protein